MSSDPLLDIFVNDVDDIDDLHAQAQILLVELLIRFQRLEEITTRLNDLVLAER